MDRSDSGPSPLEAVGADDGATDAFALLGNETRLAILVALWEESEPFAAEPTLTFTQLRARVGTSDSGQFTYHLDRLCDHFVEETDDGYRLSQAGLTVVRSVIAGGGIEAPTMEPTEIDQHCTLCGGTVQVAYERGWVVITCTDCDGIWPDQHDGTEGGHLAKLSLEPAGLVDRSPEAVYAAAWVNAFQQLYSMRDGVCPTCTGQVERTLDICPDHPEEGKCDRCDRRAKTIARLSCTVCKDWAQSTIGGIASYHPTVVAFCAGHDLPIQYQVTDLSRIIERLERTDTEVDGLSTDPPRVRLTFELDDDATWVELDESLRVVDHP